MPATVLPFPRLPGRSLRGSGSAFARAAGAEYRRVPGRSGTRQALDPHAPVYDFADPEDAEVLELPEEDMRSHAAQMGATAFLGWLEDTLSHVLRIRERQTVAVIRLSASWNGSTRNTCSRLW